MSTVKSAMDLNHNWINSLVTYKAKTTPGNHLSWLEATRQQARKDMLSSELPHRKLEAWRYTSVDNLLKQTFAYSDNLFSALQDTDIDEWIFGASDSYRLVFANGRCIPWLSNTDGLSNEIKIGSLWASLSTDPLLIEKYLAKHPAQFSQDVFQALNTAYIDDGLFIHVPENIQVDKPVEVLYVNLAQEDAPLILPRNLIILDSGASVTLVERFTSTGQSAYFNNNVTELFVDANAQLEHYRVQEESEQAHHLSRIKLAQGADSIYKSGHFAFGAKWARTDIDVRFSGKGAQCELNGLYMVKDRNLADFHLNVVHNKSHCTSVSNFRGILAGKGRAVFDGRIEVEKNAQKTDARLTNKNLLLSRDAEVDTKPQLEIDADDVKCSHGTTVGQIDPKQLFYLRSRGIDETSARKMLCLGFAGEILETLAADEVVSFIEKHIQNYLAGSTIVETGKTS